MQFLSGWKVELSKLPTYDHFKGDGKEKLDYPLLQTIYESERLQSKPEIKANLKNIIDKIDKKNGNIKDDSISLIPLSKCIKHNTVFEYMGWLDIDMVKGHPSIAIEMGKSVEMQFPAGKIKRGILKPRQFAAEYDGLNIPPCDQFYKDQLTDEIKALGNMIIATTKDKTKQEEQENSMGVFRDLEASQENEKGIATKPKKSYGNTTLNHYVLMQTGRKKQVQPHLKFYSKQEYGFNPDIVFTGKIHNDFIHFDDDYMTYMKDIKQRLFYDALGKEVAAYFILNLARGLTGDCIKLKRILFGLGEANNGKTVYQWR
eukprot:gene6861-13903_t